MQESNASSREVIRKSAERLCALAEEHRRVLGLALKEGGDRERILTGNLNIECPHRRKLREMVLETIQVLEETRKAFRSKRLEALRKKLTEVLAEDI